jgi:hypothetical protein
MAAIAALEQGRVDGITITNPAYSIAMASKKRASSPPSSVRSRRASCS